LEHDFLSSSFGSWKIFVSRILNALGNEVYFLNSHQNSGMQVLNCNTGKIDVNLIYTTPAIPGASSASYVCQMALLG
jgi:hypothetical protein